MPLQIDFDVLFRKHQHEIQEYIFYMLGGKPGDNSDAEDITSETFTRAWAARKSLKDDSNVRAWLFSIAHNICCDILRKRKRIEWNSLELLTDNTHEGVAAAISLRTKLLDAIVRSGPDEVSWSDVQAAIESMKNPQHRSALWLYYFEGYSYADIARVLKKKESGMRMLLNRARESFRTALKAL